MTLGQAVILGALQGITEFLPISSSGHLLILPELLGWEQQSLTFDVGIHVASLVAILVAMHREIQAVLAGLWRRDPVWISFVGKVLLATLPAVIAALLWKDWFEGLRTIKVTGLALVFWGILLGIADRLAAQRAASVLHKIGWGQALFIGLVQVCAFIPGTSRSGSTMSAGLLAGLDKVQVARFSFLLAIPAIAGAGILTALDVASSGLDVELSALLVGGLAAFLTAIIAIRLLFFLLKKANFLVFAVYRVILGIILLLFFV